MTFLYLEKYGDCFITNDPTSRILLSRLTGGCPAIGVADLDRIILLATAHGWKVMTGGAKNPADNQVPKFYH
jgi:hypothetical protein